MYLDSEGFVTVDIDRAYPVQAKREEKP